MKPSFDIIQCASIHPTSVNLYKSVNWYPYRPKRQRFDHLVTSDKKHKGKVSITARRKVSRAVEYLLFMANDKILPDTAHGKAYRFKIAFITLTLPSHQIHSDQEIKDSLLNQFLIELRYRFKVKNYLWRAEKQKNGNIHFHILVDRFIPWSELRDKWNRICNKLHYVDRYRDEMKQFHTGGFQVRADLLKTWDYKKQVKAYQAGKANDWNNPNSTDIHSLRKISHVQAYILKYCTKDEKNGLVAGRMWGCNENLSTIKGAQLIVDSVLSSELCLILDKYPDRVLQSTHFSCIYIDVQMLQQLGCLELYNLFGKYLFDSFDFNIQSIIPLS